MTLTSKKGFIIILVTVSLAVLILSACVIVAIGCSELIATRVRNDLLVSAYYVAISGAERLYSKLDSMTIVTWDPSLSGSAAVSGNTIGTYEAIAKQTEDVTVGSQTYKTFTIVSKGWVKNHEARVTAQYCYDADDGGLTGPIPAGSPGPINLDGASNPAKLTIEGPVYTGTPDGVTVEGNVNISNGDEYYPDLPTIEFWKTWDTETEEWVDNLTYDTNGDSSRITDTNDAAHTGTPDGKVDIDDCYVEGVLDSGLEAIFIADNIYHPEGGETAGEIDSKDAFYRYYTYELPNKEGITITPISGDQSYDPGDIENDVPIIFVDGDVEIDYNDQEWQGSGTLNHTVVAMGNIEIEQPTNRPGDTLTLIAHGNPDTASEPKYDGVYVTGTMGDKGGTIGDIVIFSYHQITIEDGGKMNASIYANEGITIDTIGDDQGKDHRAIDKLTNQWEEEDDLPLGLPVGYPGSPGYTITYSLNFQILDASGYPVWQRVQNEQGL